MDRDELIDQLLATWRRHDRIHLGLLRAIPASALRAVPASSRGRDVARIFAHLCRVRSGWVHYHETGRRPKLPRYDKGEPPTTAELREMLTGSGAAVEKFLARAFAGDARPRMFGHDPVRWLGYLIAHESHHRGQIMLALKQSGVKVAEKISMQVLWGTWISGK